jgi:DNA repair exonuclease SbcCD ATPase subunit
LRISTKRLIEKLEELKKIFEELKKIREDVEKIQRILDEITELIEVLGSADESELKAFRLLRMFVEKVKDFSDEVPLLSTFLELYIEAMKSTEFFIDEILKKYSFTGRLCEMYCRVREGVERKLRDEGETDEAEIARQGHRSGMAETDNWEKYEDAFKRQYQHVQEKKKLQDMIKQAEADKAALDPPKDPPAGGGGGGTISKPAGVNVLDYLIELSKQIKQIEERLKDPNLTPEQRAELERLREEMWRLLRRILGLE